MVREIVLAEECPGEYVRGVNVEEEMSYTL